MRRVILLAAILGIANCATAQKPNPPLSKDRKFWLDNMDKVARPVMMHIAANMLKAKMPVELSIHSDNKESRAEVAYMEAFGRTLSGLAPWLELDGGNFDEQRLRDLYRTLALKEVANAVNPETADFLHWDGGQPLVDASYIALALILSPWLWKHLDAKVQEQVVMHLKITSNTVPVYSNCILFRRLIEAFFANMIYISMNIFLPLGLPDSNEF